MRKITTHSKSSLFLMEMIFSLLFLALVSAICVRIFAASYQNRRQAREWNHIQELVTSAGEILEGSDGTADAFLTFLPNGEKNEKSLSYYYDKRWNPCARENALYRMTVTLTPSAKEKTAAVAFFRTDAGTFAEASEAGELLYRLDLHFPGPDFGKEAAQ